MMPEIMALWCGNFHKLIVTAPIFLKIVYNQIQLTVVTASVFWKIECSATQFVTHFHNSSEVNEQKIVMS